MYCLWCSMMMLLGMLQCGDGSPENHLRSYVKEPGSGLSLSTEAEGVCAGGGARNVYRPHSVSITEFGAIGDGKTLNTLAFQNAVFYLQSFAHKGGAQLYVPAGRWLTGSFSLISHLTLYLDEGAVILASKNPDDWPLIEPLPSYGRGRDLPGSRHRSLIYGNNLEDVVVSGANGTIDGQGYDWWDWFNNNSLNHTRGHLIEFISSTNIIISNITLVNSPFWTIHPVYCSNILIQSLTIFAPPDSPSTDGILPDSSSKVCIEYCSIRSGGDGVSLKSGWDQYGIEVGIPSSEVSIRRVTAETPRGSGVAFGSEMSGGIRNVLVEDVIVRNSRSGIEVKTATGRGGFITNITVSGVVLSSVNTAFRFTGSSSEHADQNYDPKAFPRIEGILIEDVSGKGIKRAGSLEGLAQAPFRDICLSNITLEVEEDDSGFQLWECCNVEGFSDSVVPEPCPELEKRSSRTFVELHSSLWRSGLRDH